MCFAANPSIVQPPPSQKPSRSIVFVLTKSHEPPRHVGAVQSTNLQPPPSHVGDAEPIKRQPPPRQATPVQPWYPHAPILHGVSSHVDARTADHFKSVDAAAAKGGSIAKGSDAATNHKKDRDILAKLCCGATRRSRRGPG